MSDKKPKYVDIDCYHDKNGERVVVGDIIAYGHNLGRCAGIRFGKVLRIYNSCAGWQEKYQLRINVMGLDDDWSFEKPKLCQRKGVLQFPNRTLKVTDFINSKTKNYFKDVEVDI